LTLKNARLITGIIFGGGIILLDKEFQRELLEKLNSEFFECFYMKRAYKLAFTTVEI